MLNPNFVTYLTAEPFKKFQQKIEKTKNTFLRISFIHTFHTICSSERHPVASCKLNHL